MNDLTERLARVDHLIAGAEARIARLTWLVERQRKYSSPTDETEELMAQVQMSLDALRAHRPTLLE